MGFNGSKSKDKEDQLITRCKLCPESIFKWQERVWICNILVGLVHKECYEKLFSEVSV